MMVHEEEISTTLELAAWGLMKALRQNMANKALLYEQVTSKLHHKRLEFKSVRSQVRVGEELKAQSATPL